MDSNFFANDEAIMEAHQNTFKFEYEESKTSYSQPEKETLNIQGDFSEVFQMFRSLASKNQNLAKEIEKMELETEISNKEEEFLDSEDLELKKDENLIDQKLKSKKEENENLKTKKLTFDDSITKLDKTLKNLKNEKREIEESHENLILEENELHQKFQILEIKKQEILEIESSNEILESNILQITIETEELIKKNETLEESLQRNEIENEKLRERLTSLQKEKQDPQGPIFMFEKLKESNHHLLKQMDSLEQKIKEIKIKNSKTIGTLVEIMNPENEERKKFKQKCDEIQKLKLEINELKAEYHVLLRKDSSYGDWDIQGATNENCEKKKELKLLQSQLEERKLQLEQEKRNLDLKRKEDLKRNWEKNLKHSLLIAIFAIAIIFTISTKFKIFQ
jgi:chromosome segregation ATPase